MRDGVRVAWALLALLPALAGCPVSAERLPVRPEPLPSERASAAPAAPAPSSRKFLDQNWDQDTREKFWFTSQGSQLIPYEWFLWLEQAGSKEPFRSDAHMDALRYIPARPSALNPDGLPIGFVRDQGEKENYLGFTCAACHTGQIDYNGTSLIIDGAPTLGNVDRFLTELSAALTKTASDSEKLERFANQLLGRGHPQSARNRLRTRVTEETALLDERLRANAVPDHQDYPGFGRIDAYGQIYNQVTAIDLGVPENARTPNAPASYPFLWGIAQSDVVQWNGAGRNRSPNEAFPISVLVRNALEVIGVFGRLGMRGGLGVYPSSVNLVNLGHLEKPLCWLHAPKWRSDVFGSLDADLASKGKAVYESRCAGCHALVADEEKYSVEPKLRPIDAVKTDPNLARNAHDRVAKTGDLEKKPKNLLGDFFGPEAYAHEIVTNAVVGVIVAKWADAAAGVVAGTCAGPVDKLTGADQQAQVMDALRQLLPMLEIMPLKYKPRPLNGIWATAPYLHNGSVPSLAELLKPADQRVKVFHVGNREFDPVNVGFRTEAEPGTTPLDTSIDGNHNTGHPYADGLSDEQRRQILEFLKTL